MSDNANQLIFEHRKGQSQFAYFQLGVAASAIAFAIHETAELSLTDAPWPLGAAVALWALSFAIGCFGIDARQDGIHSNALFLHIFGDIPAQHGNMAIAQVLEDAKKDVKKDLRKPVTLFCWQKWALFTGALFYIGGHIMQMATIPPKQAIAATAPVKAPPAKQRPAPEGARR